MLCRSCFPRRIRLSDLAETRELSPHMAFALSMLLPGAGHVYAGRRSMGYLLNASVTLGVLAFLLTALVISPRTFVGAILMAALVVPLLAIAIGRGAYRAAVKERCTPREGPISLAPLWLFMVVGLGLLGLVGVTLISGIAYAMLNGEQLLGL